MKSTKLLLTTLLSAAIMVLLINPADSISAPATETISVSVAYATDEFLGNYDSVTDFVDYKSEYAQKIAFTTNMGVKNFRYIELDHKMDDAGIIYFEKAVLYSLDELLPEQPFVVTWMEVGDAVAYRAITFVDENDKTRYYYMEISGEDGSLLLTEFQPVS